MRRTGEGYEKKTFCEFGGRSVGHIELNILGRRSAENSGLE
jgi:hypothetical protein